MRPSRLFAFLLVLAILSGCTFGSFTDRTSRPGSAAKDLLDPREHEKLVVELDFPSGYGPNAAAKNVLRSTLQQVTGRPAEDIVFVEDPSVAVEASRRYSFDDIRAMEDRLRSRHTGGDSAVLYLLYVAGASTEDTDDGKVLGAAYRGTSLVIFKGNIRSAANEGGLLDTRPSEECIERSVLVHEFGHAAGLVNLGTPMVRDHEDPANPGHSANKESVMYYAVENSGDLLRLFTGGCSGVPYQFDGDDLADLRALRDS